MNIDYNAVIEILKSFLNNEKIEILGISIGEERQVKDAIRNLLTAYEKEKETSHYIQSQLDIANAKLVEEKEENKKDIKFKRILADNLKRHIESITIGKSITFPCGWVYKEDLLDLINDIKWEE